jgi:ComF family protein
MAPAAALRRLADVLGRLADLLYPKRCLVCGDDLEPGIAGPLCTEHRLAIVPIEEPFCDRCGKKMFARSVEDLLCDACRQAEPHFDRAFSATLYNDVMRPFVHRYKYDMRHYLHAPLAHWMIEFMHRYIDVESLDAIVPVPLHWRRFQYRGFNQATAVARPIAREFPLPIITRVLRRWRHTLPQVHLDPDERVENIRDAFRVRRAERIEGKRLLLVDDVYTTGATMNECARVLKDAGAASVIAFTLTRPL